MSGTTRARRRTADGSISYEDSKRIAAGKDRDERIGLSRRDDVRPEVLFYLSNDPSPEVRRNVAANPRTPAHAGPILARDGDDGVRCELAERIGRLTADLAEQDRGQARRYVLETLDTLARDQTRRVRRILSETLKADPKAPPSVIRTLASDDDLEIANPVLEFSPLLTDGDLLEIIGDGCASGKLRAISRRHGLGAEVADAIVATDDEAAITDLLSNRGAQVREDTLEQLVEQAAGVAAWHRPLVERPRLTSGAAVKLAAFVADSLVRRLQERSDLDRDTARRVGHALRGQIVEPEALAGADAAERPFGRVPGEKALERAMRSFDMPTLREGLALRGNLDEAVVRKILESSSAKGVTALVWKAGLGMRFAVQLQLRVARIPPRKALRPRDGIDFPLTPEDMDWQIAFFESLDDGPLD